jgi:DeoR/GlpR family transcriptional regulator of sugar metabolism
MVSHGDVVLLDVGSTTTAIAQALRDRTDLSDVTVVTNALNIALLLEPAAVAGRISIIVAGGTARCGTRSELRHAPARAAVRTSRSSAAAHGRGAS